MTAPIWMAAPPEVHSALLSSGPGPGPLVAAAGAWSGLSAEYAAVATELGALLAEVQGGVWEGPSAASYAAAHAPYLAWLTKASADAAATAAQHETAAAAYTAALAAMPTLPELATNHVVHGALLATNFFGINTIPIAVNEADYARMWVQAATTMGTYQAVSTAALASTPRADPAPQILKSDAQAQSSSGFNFWQWLQNFLSGISNQTVDHDPTVNNWLDQLIASMLRNFGYVWDPAQGTLNGLDYDAYTNAGTLSFWVARALELFEDFQQFFVYLQQNPILAIQYLISLALFDWPTHIAEIFLSQPELLAPALIVVAAPLAPLGALAGLAGLAAVPAPAVVPAPPPIVPAPPSLLPALGSTPLAAPAGVPASAPAPAATATTGTVAGSTLPPAPPAPGAPAFFPPYVVGPPGMGVGSGVSVAAGAGAKRKSPEPDTTAAAAAGAVRETARARRRRRARQRDHGDEFMEMNVDVDPDWGADPVVSASDRGAGDLGFAGTARGRAAGAAGLTTLAPGEFGGGPRMPMLPGSWTPDGEPYPRDDSAR
ncbi:PPE family protein [Mycobacterium shigaense]|uniref:Putative PPE family protein PPE3 n=1 Tax=Mycobacterium shigaense TaxID=722731 RepID=A0A1Z4ECG7_9MYCO|nr:PPE family protein [Mycobacterium shigaense]PRI17140.1 hypothetical protein B2J96_01375 [Mycobacterium shigaense]BAX90643.1 putative PPE family protein PPE3 [Mycobacterium shigaense]